MKFKCCFTSFFGILYYLFGKPFYLFILAMYET